MSDKLKFSKIMVEINGGAIVNITDLPKEQYEYFLSLTNQLRLAYMVMDDDRSNKKSKPNI